MWTQKCICLWINGVCFAGTFSPFSAIVSWLVRCDCILIYCAPAQCQCTLQCASAEVRQSELSFHWRRELIAPDIINTAVLRDVRRIICVLDCFVREILYGPIVIRDSWSQAQCQFVHQQIGLPKCGAQYLNTLDLMNIVGRSIADRTVFPAFINDDDDDDDAHRNVQWPIDVVKLRACIIWNG